MVTEPDNTIIPSWETAYQKMRRKEPLSALEYYVLAQFGGRPMPETTKLLHDVIVEALVDFMRWKNKHSQHGLNDWACVNYVDEYVKSIASPLKNQVG